MLLQSVLYLSHVGVVTIEFRFLNYWVSRKQSFCESVVFPFDAVSLALTIQVVHAAEVVPSDSTLALHAVGSVGRNADRPAATVRNIEAVGIFTAFRRHRVRLNTGNRRRIFTMRNLN
jgi:hypothetical protein